jgi:hypothetical protein
MQPLRKGASWTSLTLKSAGVFTRPTSSARSLLYWVGSLARWYKMCVNVTAVVSLESLGISLVLERLRRQGRRVGGYKPSGDDDET